MMGTATPAAANPPQRAVELRKFTVGFPLVAERGSRDGHHAGRRRMDRRIAPRNQLGPPSRCRQVA